MAKIRIPSFLTRLDQEEKVEMIKQHKSWKTWKVAEHLVAYLQDELDRLIQEDEKDSPISWFQTRWSKAKRLGRREQIRRLIKDLQ